MRQPITELEYFAAAMRVLGDRGPEHLTIAVVCEQLEVTKGSFYHHFRSMSEFVTALMRWFTNYNEELANRFERESELPRQLELAIETSSRLDHAAEAALRGWARSNPEVAAAVAAVDERRERYAVGVLLAAGLHRRDAALFGRLLLDVLVGRQQREQPLDTTGLARDLAVVKDLALSARSTAAAG
ncbi:TetR/AcrR family transcriptional regulator [Nitriliruptor alkaliphilus]|uniref:TetR/AcrR family transcriptional regulator n=1 Tax=Nitriliruptor alkaliphilus TaxID=427918 RepID=UPI000697E5D1|nr:TetR/AcrR family transcriptional regulator [Nitriliruptor alkaliphilus]